MKCVPKRTFDRFLKGKGINLANYSASVVEVESIKVSSFKNKATEIKNIYNHVFKFKPEIDWRMVSVFENIDRLKFEMKIN